MTLRLGFLASHGGSNVQVIIDACGSGTLDAEPCVLVSNNSDAPVMARARAAGIATYHLSSHTHPDPSLLDDAILEALTRHGAALIVLAGYMKKIGPRTLARYRGLVLNIHRLDSRQRELIEIGLLAQKFESLRCAPDANDGH